MDAIKNLLANLEKFTKQAFDSAKKKSAVAMKEAKKQVDKKAKEVKEAATKKAAEAKEKKKWPLDFSYSEEHFCSKQK